MGTLSHVVRRDVRGPKSTIVIIATFYRTGGGFPLDGNGHGANGFLNFVVSIGVGSQLDLDVKVLVDERVVQGKHRSDAHGGRAPSCIVPGGQRLKEDVLFDSIVYRVARA